MKYDCLVLDHDDTAVDSTPLIHYPAHLEVMRRLRPDHEPVGLDGWFLKNFDPGIMAYLVGELGFSKDELQEEIRIWRQFSRNLLPSFFPGFVELLEEYSRFGGRVAVVSHSEGEIIGRHYQTRSFEPDLILGWEDDDEKRKPHPWPLYRVMEELDVSPDDILVVDDLKPGILMARRAKVKAAAAGWAHHLVEVEKYMRRVCDVYFSSVAEFREHVLGEFLG